MRASKGADNPFRYGDVATGTFFTDRQRELRELTEDVRSGQNVVIISPRRFGKTSLVFEAIDQLRRDDVLVAYLDLFRTPTPVTFANHLARAIYDGLVAPLDRMLQRAIDFVQHLPLRPKVTLNDDATPSFEFTAAGADSDVTRTIERLLALPDELARGRKRRVALVFDEFQEVLTIDPHLPALMRSIFQAQPEVAHVFLGSKRHLMQRLFTERSEPLFRSARPIPLHAIPETDFGAFIVDRFTATSTEIEPDAVQRILSTTECHPHDTQELCHFTWSLARAERAAVTVDLVVQALEHVLDAENARFSTLWDGASIHQRQVLGALAIEPGRTYSEAYRSRHHLGASSSVSRSLSRLVEQDLVEHVPKSGYRIPEAFFREWLRRLQQPAPRNGRTQDDRLIQRAGGLDRGSHA